MIESNGLTTTADAGIADAGAAPDAAPAPAAPTAPSAEPSIAEELGRVYDSMTEAAENPPQAPAAPPPPPAIQYPETWTPEQRQAVEAWQDQAQRQWMVEQYNGWFKQHQEALQPFQDYKTRADEVLAQLNGVWGPLAQQLGASPADLHQMAARYMLWSQQDPQGFVRALAKHHGIALADSANPEFGLGNEFADPNAHANSVIAGLQRELQGLRQAQAQLVQGLGQHFEGQRQDQQYRELHTSVRTELQQFMEAKGQDGKLLHPHMNNPEVSATVAALMNGNPQVYDLKKAYEVAAKQIPPPPPNPADRARQARLASAGVNQGGSVPTRPQAMSLLDEVRANYEAQASR